MSEILDHAVEPLSLKWTVSPPAGDLTASTALDVRRLLDRLSAFTGLSEGNIILHALTKYERGMLRAADTDRATFAPQDALQARPVGRPRIEAVEDATPRLVAKKPLKQLQNGANQFLVVSANPNMYGQSIVGFSLVLKHEVRNETFSLTLEGKAAEALLVTCSRSMRQQIKASNIADIVGNVFPFICSNGQPIKTQQSELKVL